jgi:hypothetical protein
MLTLSRFSSPSLSAKRRTSNADCRSRWALLAKPALSVALTMGVLTAGQCEVDVFYWTVLAPDIVNPGREEQGSFSV